MPSLIPTLSSAGWIGTIAEKGDYALSCFITSEYSQSVIFAGSIASLQYLVKTHAGDELMLETAAQETLDGLMRRYLGDNVDVRVRVRDPDPEQPSMLVIGFSCLIRDNGKEYQLSKEVQLLNGKLLKVIELNNG